MPTPFPKEFRDDVIEVALNRDAGVTLAQIAKDFGIHVGTLDTWMHQARTEAGEQPDVTTSEHDELQELRKTQPLTGTRKRSLTACGSVCIAGQSAGKRLYPLVRQLATEGIPVVVSCRVLKLARQPYYRWLHQPVPESDLVATYRANAIFDAHREDPEFGHRLLADEAKASGRSMADLP